MLRYASSRIYTDDTVGTFRAAIVFGAGLTVDGGPTAVLEDRVFTAAKLYAAGKVEVLGLKYVEHPAVEAIKQAKADKVYRLRVTFGAKISEESLISALDIIVRAPIMQSTPIRVAHRRADLVRERKVHYTKLEELSPDGLSALIVVGCQGGLYVKELVSGDEGRTKPNLAENLNAEAKVAELDVIKIEGIII